MEKRCPLYCLVDELTFTAHVGSLIIIIITLHNYVRFIGRGNRSSRRKPPNWYLTPLSAISWRPLSVVEEAGVPGENHLPWAGNW
jgi:hypothetical protein